MTYSDRGATPRATGAAPCTCEAPARYTRQNRRSRGLFPACYESSLTGVMKGNAELTFEDAVIRTSLIAAPVLMLLSGLVLPQLRGPDGTELSVAAGYPLGMGYLAIRPPMLHDALTNRRDDNILSSTARAGTNGAATPAS